jgi:hypothetical protein
LKRAFGETERQQRKWRARRRGARRRGNCHLRRPTVGLSLRRNGRPCRLNCRTHDRARGSGGRVVAVGADRAAFFSASVGGRLALSAGGPLRAGAGRGIFCAVSAAVARSLPSVLSAAVAPVFVGARVARARDAQRGRSVDVQADVFGRPGARGGVGVFCERRSLPTVGRDPVGPAFFRSARGGGARRGRDARDVFLSGRGQIRAGYFQPARLRIADHALGGTRVDRGDVCAGRADRRHLGLRRRRDGYA